MATEIQKEWLIHPSKLASLPEDARMVLGMRAKINAYRRRLEDGGVVFGIRGPVACGLKPVLNLVLEVEDPKLKQIALGVTHPLSLCLPTSILRALVDMGNLGSKLKEKVLQATNMDFQKVDF